MLYFCGPSGIKTRFVDVSHQAIVTSYFPISVGVRSQAMKLHFLTPDMEGRFLQPTQSFQNILNTFEKRFDKSIPKPILHQTIIGDTISLIYSPFHIEDKVYDAILDKPVSAALPENLNVDDFPTDQVDWNIHFISTLCPSCGWDLEGERNALVLSCKNCNSTWYPVGKKLKQLKYAQLQGKGDDAIYLPFWRIKADISGINLNSYADLIEVANLPKVVQTGWFDVPFRFWIPAFKVRPQLFLRLASHITLSQPHENLIADLPRTRIHPSTLPVEEAIESLKLTLTSFIKPRKTLLSKLQDIHIDAKRFTLVFIPFNDEYHELIQPDFQLAINKNVLALSKNL